MSRTVFYPRCKAMLSVVLDGRGQPNSKPLTVDCSPMSATVVRNTYHEADTWSLEFDARTMPFDPETVASCAARIYMWDSEGDETRQWHLDKYEMIRGLADEVSLEIGEHQTISMSGRDYTAALDGEWDPRKMVVAGVPLDEAVQAIADEAAPESSSARFAVEWQVTDENGASIEPPISGGARRSTKKKGMWVKPGKTHWEVIYDLVIGHGFIVFIRDSSIIIANPRTQTSSSLLLAPRIVHGRNLISLKAERKLAKERVPQILIRAWDPKLRKRIEVKYPPTARTITTGLGLKKNEDMVVPAPKGVYDRDSLLRFAKMRWDLMARAEASYTFTTRHMRVPKGEVEVLLSQLGDSFQAEFDLMGLQAGDAIGVGFDPFNREQLRALQVGERVEFITAMGYSPSVASFVANNLERIQQFEQPYYCRRAEYHFSVDDGLEIEVEGVNFASEAHELAWADGQAA